MTENARVALSRAVVAALVIAPALIVTWAFRPGYMNADTLNAYAVTQPWGDFNDFHTPLILKLWDVFETAGVGSPTIVLFAQTLTMVAGFFLVFHATLRRVPAALASALLLFTPLVLSQVMLLGRDTWMTSFVIFQLGSVICFVGSSGRTRRVWLVLVVFSGLFVLAARQNALPLEFFVVAALASRVYADRTQTQTRARRRPRAVLVPLALGGAATILAFAVVSTLPRLVGARHVEAGRGTYAYDLTGMSLHEDEVLMGREAFPSQDLDVLRERWNPQLVESVVVPLGEGPVRIVEPEAVDELSSAWREHVRERPGAYLAVRWGLFQRVLGISHPPTYVLHPGVDTNPFGFATANPDANDSFRDYVGWFTADDTFATGPDVFRPWIWLGLGLVSAGVLLNRRVRARPGALEVGLAVVGALAYEATFAVLAMSESFRYSYPAIVVSVVGIVFAVATLFTRPSPAAQTNQEAASDREPATDAPSVDESADHLDEPVRPGAEDAAVDGRTADPTPSSH